ncbi:MAG TPA: PQQ-binding-like beta-propeller repeat protein [Gemmataceae bacterium]|nr:PQQ-binding-like beta-propeller repeat protein [Gemmataceae bacterium]
MQPRRIALLSLFLAVPTLAAADWDRFRGPNGLGTADDTTIPVSFGPKDALWKTPIPGRGNSSPIVSKGKVFLQTASEDGNKRSLVCLNATNGAMEWSKDLKGQKGAINKKNSLASSTPAADGERVYAVFWDGNHISLTGWDYTGAQLWSKDLGGYVSQHGPGLSPMVVGDKVVLNIDQDELAEVDAFDAKSGDLVWKKSRRAYRASYTTPFVLERNGKLEVIVASTAGVTSYDPKDGAVIWNWTWVWKEDPTAPKTKNGPPGGALRNVGGPIYHDGLIIAYGGDGGGQRHLVALKAGTSGDVTDSALIWEKKKGTPYVPMVLAKGDYLYWVSDKENKGLCVELKTGKVMWEERLRGAGEVTACPVMIDGKIYSINESGRMTVFEAGPKFNLLADNDLKEDVFASPAVADGRLYIRTSNNLYCFGKK